MWLAALELVYELSLTYEITGGKWEWPGRTIYRCLTLLGYSSMSVLSVFLPVYFFPYSRTAGIRHTQLLTT